MNQTSSVPFHRRPDLLLLRRASREIADAERGGDHERARLLRREYNRLVARLRRVAASTYPHLSLDSLDHLVVYHVLHGHDVLA